MYLSSRYACLLFSEQFTSCPPAPPRPASLPLKVGSGDLMADSRSFSEAVQSDYIATCHLVHQ